MSKPIADKRPIVRLALNRSEVALSIGVSIGSVDQMVAEGALPKPRKCHTRKLWLVAEIEAYLQDWPIEGGEARRVDLSPLENWRDEQHLRKGREGCPIQSIMFGKACASTQNK